MFLSFPYFAWGIVTHSMARLDKPADEFPIHQGNILFRRGSMEMSATYRRVKFSEGLGEISGSI
jgi:hypothetical protein